MPEKGEGGAASPVRWPQLAVIRGDSACLNRFAADIMGSLYALSPYEIGLDLPDITRAKDL